MNRYVIQNPDCDWEDIPSLPSSAYTLLRAKFKAATSLVHSVLESNDGVTTKLLIKLQVKIHTQNPSQIGIQILNLN